MLSEMKTSRGAGQRRAMVSFALNLLVFLSILRCLLDVEVEMFRCSRVLQVWSSGEGSGLATGQGTLEGRGALVPASQHLFCFLLEMGEGSHHQLERKEEEE